MQQIVLKNALKISLAFLFILLFYHSLYSQSKVRIAVLPFTNSYGSNVSSLMTTKLEAGIANLGRFVTVDRTSINKVIKEQNFQLSDFVDQNTAVKVGYLLGAQKIITGSITRYSSNYDSDIKCYSAIVEASLKIIDVQSGEIESSIYDASGSSCDKNSSVSLQDALNDCVKNIILEIRKIFPVEEISGDLRIIEKDWGNVIIRGGRNIGIKEGTVFEVYSTKGEIIDKVTGEVLGKKTKKIGIIKITEVNDKISSGKILEGRYSIKENSILKERPGLSVSNIALIPYYGQLFTNIKHNQDYKIKETKFMRYGGLALIYDDISKWWIYEANMEIFNANRISGWEINPLIFKLRINLIPEYFKIYPTIGVGIGELSQSLTLEAEDYIDDVNFLVDKDDKTPSCHVGYAKAGIGFQLNFHRNFGIHGEASYKLSGRATKWTVDEDKKEDPKELTIPSDYLLYPNVKYKGLSFRGGLFFGF